MTKQTKVIIWICATTVILMLLTMSWYRQNNLGKTSGTDTTKLDARINDADLLYASLTWAGLCSNENNEPGGCFTKEFLSTSGKLVKEYEFVPAKGGEAKKATQKILIAPADVAAIKQEIKDSNIMSAVCNESEIMDAGFEYVITLEGTQKIFNNPIESCKKTFDILDGMVRDADAMAQNPATAGFDAKNGTYVIEGKTITLKNGESQTEAAPNSATKITTKYFGNHVVGDFNGDGTKDVAFLLTQETGGTGTFYYVVAALKKENKFTVTNAVFVGDRIAPQSTFFSQQTGELHVAYATRATGDPMTKKPSLGGELVLRITQAGALEKAIK
jgi:hypothetical protein